MPWWKTAPRGIGMASEPSLLTRVSPIATMELGITDHVWSIGELVHAAFGDGVQMQGKRALASFRTIEGGKEWYDLLVVDKRPAIPAIQEPLPLIIS